MLDEARTAETHKLLALASLGGPNSVIDGVKFPDSVLQMIRNTVKNFGSIPVNSEHERRYLKFKAIWASYVAGLGSGDETEPDFE